MRRFLIGLVGVAAAALAALYGWLYFNQSELLFRPNPEVASPASLGLEGVEERPIPTADGETLRAFWMAPRPGQPVFLFFSGQGASLKAQAKRFRRLAPEGVGLLAVALRGFSGSTGTPSEAGAARDAAAGYRWLRARYRADEIVIHGFSLGSAVAVRLAAHAPARALVLEAPFTSALELAEDRYPYAPISLLMRDKMMSRDWITRVRMPVLIAHGDADATVPFAMGRELYARANPPKRFHAFPGGGHSTLVADGLYDVALAFVAAPAAGVGETISRDPRGAAPTR